jgi:acyl-coenzyme A thioesterase PaaI-like protein
MYKLNLKLLNILPFAKYVGVQKHDSKRLELENHNNVHNHVRTVHAAAQFTLGETQSGLYLLSVFPQYLEQMTPLLRSSTVKYKNPAQTKLVATARIDEADRVKFENQFLKKGRAMLTVHIELKDTFGMVTMVGTFVWYVQRTECTTRLL